MPQRYVPQLLYPFVGERIFQSQWEVDGYWEQVSRRTYESAADAFYRLGGVHVSRPLTCEETEREPGDPAAEQPHDAEIQVLTDEPDLVPDAPGDDRGRRVVQDNTGPPVDEAARNSGPPSSPRSMVSMASRISVVSNGLETSGAARNCCGTRDRSR